MVAMSLPFIWIGVMLTLQRLRSARLPLWMVAFFFAPFVKLVFFLILCVIPHHDSGEPVHARTSNWIRIVPAGALGSAAVSLLISVPLGFGLGIFGVRVMANYGWGLFVAVPFTMGFVAALVYGLREPRTLLSSIGVACLTVVLLAGVLFGVAVEGLVCLIMAAPLALPLAAFGGFCAYKAQRGRWVQRDAPVILSVLILVVPGIQSVEHLAGRASPIFVVRTSLDV